MLLFTNYFFLKGFVFFSTTLITGILEEFHECQTHGVNHCTQYIHKDIDAVTDQEDQSHDNRTCNDIVGTHTCCQTVEHTGQDTSGQTEGKQTYIREHITQQTGSHIVAVPQSQSDVDKIFCSGLLYR